MRGLPSLLHLFPKQNQLPPDEFHELMKGSAGDRVVAAQACLLPPGALIFLLADDLYSLRCVSLSELRPVVGGPTPDLNRVSVTDYGQTMCLGEYEICVDFLVGVD